MRNVFCVTNYFLRVDEYTLHDNRRDIKKISSTFLIFVRNARTISLISSFPYAPIDFNEEFKRQETFDLGRGRR